jgi:hypothetical protein
VESNLAVRVSSRLSATVGPSFTRDFDDWKYYDQYGDPGVDTTHYTFARMDRKTLRLTSRVDFTATPNLSVQLYAEPFVTAGRYTDWKELADPRSHSYAKRFKPYRSPVDAAGNAVYTLDDFNYKSFRSNAVLRWEYRPGSTLFLVWQQGRSQDDRDLGSFRLGRDLDNLFGARPDNTLLIKTSYWFSF